MILDAIGYFIGLFSNHPYLSPLILGMLYEEIFLVSTVLSSHNEIPIVLWSLFGYFGIIISDVFWFHIIKIKPLLKFSKKISEERKKLVSKSKVGRFPAPTTLKGFCMAKTFWGLRTWGIFYCSIHEQKFSRFLRNTLIATALWMAIFIPLGLLVGKGIYKIFEITQNAGLIIILIISILIGGVALSKFILSKFRK